MSSEASILISSEAGYRDLMGRLSCGAMNACDVTEQEASIILRVAKTKERRSREKTAQLARSGQTRRAKRAQRHYIGSWAGRLVAASHVIGRRQVDETHRFAVIFMVASQIGYSHLPGQVRLTSRQKSDGRTRVIRSFDFYDKAQQRLLANALLPFLGSHPSQFGQRGTKLAAETLRTAVERSPPDYVFMHVDIRNFFDNIDEGWIRENVPLPRCMMRWAFNGSYCIRQSARRSQAHPNAGEETKQNGRRGIPQGSALSPIIAEFCVTQMINEFEELIGHLVVNYSDNFGLLCEPGDVECLEQVLRERFNAHPAGPFTIRIETRSIKQECRFAGYSFCRDENGRCTFWVRKRDWETRYYYLWGKLFESHTAEDIETTIRKIDGFCGAWPLWSGRNKLREKFDEMISRVLSDKGRVDLIPVNVSARLRIGSRKLCLDRKIRRAAEQRWQSALSGVSYTQTQVAMVHFTMHPGAIENISRLYDDPSRR